MMDGKGEKEVEEEEDVDFILILTMLTVGMWGRGTTDIVNVVWFVVSCYLPRTSEGYIRYIKSSIDVFPSIALTLSKGKIRTEHGVCCRLL